MASDEMNPLAHPDAMILSSDRRARFTVLTDRLIRLEWSAGGDFEDRASQAFVNRRVPPPSFRVERRRGETRIITAGLRLFFREDGKAFHAENLRIEGAVSDRPFEWRPGDEGRGNLGGTTRTLDGVDGRCEVEPGILSRDGWALVDDSSGLVFEPARGARPGGVGSWDWLATRNRGVALDWYFFGYGRRYADALRDFTRLAGRIPLPPRYVFGAWWSRYWAYTADQLRSLVEEFRGHDVPLDVLVIDMDWHLDGWTGYTWSPAHFPDPSGFLQWTDRHGLQITLNLHPADGVGPHEEQFDPMCRWMGLDPGAARFVPFDCTDRRFVEGYFRLLHWPLEKQGVDFWWMDWQQGTRSNTPGLDPLWWLNHLHWKDLEERSDPLRDESGVRRGRRPLVFSRWGGLGNHRYPIGFSGDTFSTWVSLAWQPEFTAMAGNVGYAYWSHDIGGHQPGPVEPELYLRWIQYGALSPVLRTHTSKNPRGERRIWESPEREFKAMREAFRLRYRLLPYIYTAARRAYDDAQPLCRPIYHAWPEADEAYSARFRNEYLFGDDLLAAPVVSAGDAVSRCAAVEVWIPPGTWTHWFTGESFEGPGKIELHVPMDEIPLFVRGGAIIPAAPAMRWSSERPLDPLTLIAWPGGTSAHRWRDESGSATLYEDDGESAGYARGACVWTPIEMGRTGNLIRVTIGPVEGSFRGMLEHRGYEIRLVDRWPARDVRLDGVRHAFEYDDAKLTIVVRVPSRPVREPIHVEVDLDPADESPLRAGAHGRLKMLEWAGALLGEGAPRPLREAASGETRRRVIADRGGPAAETWSPDSLWRIACEVHRGDAALPVRQEVVGRLLRLSGTLQIEPSVRAGTIRTVASARLVGEAGAIAESVEVRVTPSREWGVGASVVANGLETREWLVGAPARSTRLKTTTTIRRAGESIGLTSTARVLPSINAWWVVGPFDCPFERAMETALGPELLGLASLSHNDSYPSGSGSVRWRRVERQLNPGDDPTGEFVVDLQAALGGRRDHAVAYAMTYLDADRDREALLALGSDDGVAAWINGVLVHRQDVQRGYGPMQDAVPIRLRTGRNLLVLKITQREGGWAFGAHVLEVDGSGPAEGIEPSVIEREA